MARGSQIETSVPPEDELEDDTVDGRQGDEGDDGLDYETRARAMGWKPEAQYRGIPGRWLPAKDFVERGEKELPLLRDQLRRLQGKVARGEANQAEIATLRAQLVETQEVLGEVRGLVKSAHERGREEMRRELEETQDRAAAEGDAAGVRTAREALRRLDKEEAAATLAPKPATKEVVPPAPPQPPEITAFKAANPWFDTDPYLFKQMVSAHERVLRNHPGWPLATQLQYARQEVMKANPDMFPDEMSGMSDEEVDEALEDEVDDNAPPPPPRRTVRPAASVSVPRNAALPARGRQAQVDRNSLRSIEYPAEQADARKAFQRWQRIMPDLTEQEYMAVYYNPKIDVLEERAKAAKERK